MRKQYGKEIMSKVLEMKETGRTHREIAEELGYRKEQIDKLVERYNKKQREQPIVPGRQGRPRKKPLSTTEEYQRKIKQLEMENELLRSFLQEIGRR